MDAIYKRRSIRKYKDIPVTPEQREKILRAGMASPTSENDQEWQFIQIDRIDLRAKTVELDSYAKAVNTAPLCFLVCADMRCVSDHDEIFWVQDLSAAAENMLIEAADMGLGSLWMGLYREQRKQFQQMLGLPEYINPLMLLTFGTADEDKKPIDRYLEDRVHVDGW